VASGLNNWLMTVDPEPARKEKSIFNSGTGHLKRKVDEAISNRGGIEVRVRKGDTLRTILETLFGGLNP